MDLRENYEYIGNTRRMRQTRKYKDYKCAAKPGYEYDLHPSHAHRCLKVCGPRKTRRLNRRCALDDRLQNPAEIVHVIRDKMRNHYSKSMAALLHAMPRTDKQQRLSDRAKRLLTHAKERATKSTRDLAQQWLQQTSQVSQRPKDVDCIDKPSGVYNDIRSPLPQRDIDNIRGIFDLNENSAYEVSTIETTSISRTGKAVLTRTDIPLIDFCSLDPLGSVSKFKLHGEYLVKRQLSSSIIDYFIEMIKTVAPSTYKIGSVVNTEGEGVQFMMTASIRNKNTYMKYSRIFFIVNPGGHYYLAVIDMATHQVFVFDSWRPSEDKRYPQLERYILPKLKDDTNIDFTIKSVGGIPSQNDADSCGMYACMFLLYLVKGLCLQVNSPHGIIPAFDDRSNDIFRYRMAQSFLIGKLAFDIHEL